MRCPKDNSEMNEIMYLGFETFECPTCKLKSPTLSCAMHNELERIEDERKLLVSEWVHKKRSWRK